MLWGPTLPFPCGFVEIFQVFLILISNVAIINPSQVYPLCESVSTVDVDLYKKQSNEIEKEGKEKTEKEKVVPKI